MAYDEDLGRRVRQQLRGEAGVTEKAMFGGLAFLLDGNMSVGISSDDLLVRVGPEASDVALDEPDTRAFDMTGRPMKGWILVAPTGTSTAAQLDGWLQRGVRFARGLPAKAARA